jgi:glutamate 5-kinase
MLIKGEVRKNKMKGHCEQIEEEEKAMGGNVVVVSSEFCLMGFGTVQAESDVSERSSLPPQLTLNMES